MKRRRFDATSGLDLFLDAICNTFGGIVFISMLVVVLINATSVSSLEETKVTKRQDPARLAALAAEKTKLTEEIRRQEEAATILNDSPMLSDLLAQIKAERSTAKKLQRELDEARRRLKEATAEIDRLSSSRRQTAESIAVAEERLKDLRDRLAKEIAKRTKQIGVPIERDTDLNETAFFLKNGRFGPLNVDNIDRVGGAVRPKSGAGLQVSKPVDPAKLDAVLAGFDPKTQYVAIALWEDSFDRWPLVQKALRRKGFSYRLLLLSKDELVGTGGSGGRVQ